MQLLVKDCMHGQSLASEKPSRALEEKKARFFVSSGLSLVHSGVLGCGSDSPVRELLSTYVFVVANTLRIVKFLYPCVS